MADIINFNDPNGVAPPSPPSKENRLQAVQMLISELQREAGVIDDLLVYVRDINGDTVLFHTDGISIEEKSYIVQILQEDIQSEIASMSEETEVTFTPDLD